MFPRRRMLHSKIWNSEQFLSLDIPARLLYVGLISAGDDSGRLRGDERFLKRSFFPYDKKIKTETIRQMCNKMHEIGLIEIYSQGNGTYIHHPKWKKYQTLRADRSKDSDFPAPPSAHSPSDDDQLQAQVNQSEVNQSEAKQSEDTYKKIESVSTVVADYERDDRRQKEIEEINEAIGKSKRNKPHSWKEAFGK